MRSRIRQPLLLLLAVYLLAALGCAVEHEHRAVRTRAVARWDDLAMAEDCIRSHTEYCRGGLAVNR